MPDLMDILIDLLPEFDLPEPESPFHLEDEQGRVPFLMAFPDHKFGIVQGGDRETRQIGEWCVWSCDSEERARLACAQIARKMGIEPSVLRLDFSRIDALMASEQFQAAKTALENLQDEIQQDHPDWSNCEKKRVQIRKAERQKKKKIREPLKPEIPKVSLVRMLQADAQRIKAPATPEFNILGLFSPDDETLSAVDAVWVAQVKNAGISVWAACLEGNPAYEKDTEWETLGNEVELLQGLLARTAEGATFLWNKAKPLMLLQNWHRRAMGDPMGNIQNFVDLQALCQVAFPTAHRADLPDSLCKQLEVPFCDEMGNGGPLAAMVALMTTCVKTFGALPIELRIALRNVLGFTLDDTARPTGLFEYGKGSSGGPVLPNEWLDVFLPTDGETSLQGYVSMLIRHHRKLPLNLHQSKGNRDPHGYDVMDFFKKGGFLSQAADFEYRERANQIGFSGRIEEAVVDTVPYMLEAGTGIGKTMGYLVPTLLSRKRTFISTHTKALQEQAWTKDVPMVLKAFSIADVERSVAIIKGKGNYICLQTAVEWLEDPGDILRTEKDVWFLAALLHWLLITKTGWVSEIEHLGNWRLLEMVGRDQAPPKLSDTWAEIDPHARAKDAAGKADLVLANHSYIFALAISADAGKQEMDILVLDEAHNIDDVVTEVLTLHFRPWALKQVIDSLLKKDTAGKVRGLYRTLIYHPQQHEHPDLKVFSTRIEEVESQLNIWCLNARERLCDMFRNMADVDPDLPATFPLKEFWVESLYVGAKKLMKSIESFAGNIHQLLELLPSLKGLPKRIAGSLGSLEEHLNDNAEALESLFETTEDMVHWGEARVGFDEHGRVLEEKGLIAWSAVLHSTPLDIAQWLRENVNSLYKHRVYLSATLSIGGDFSSAIERFGLTEDDDTKKPMTGIYPSPFDYKRQALLCVPHDIRVADPKLRVDPLYIEQQSQHIAELAAVSEGKMMVLFTSRMIMREMAPRLQDRLKSDGIIVLSQTDASRSALIDRLRDAPRKGEKIVLLGLRAFWEGVDVAGEALTVLVISRLPFEYQGHPVVQARMRHYESKGFDRDYFGERVVPKVFLYLRQMYGRLIRTESDRGVTVITDPRIYIRKYGKNLLKRLPETTTVVDKGPVVVEAVKKFISGEEVNSSFEWGELPSVAFDLSPEQKAIVDSPSKRILVRAAAGSGKTHALISRLVRLVELELAKPEEILALTFTNKAMKVMYERLEQSLGGQKAYPIHRNILTYHRLASRIIRQDDRDQDKETAFVDERNPELQNELFSKARAEAELMEQMLSNDDARTMISYAQNGLVNESELKNKISEWKETNYLLSKFGTFFLAYTRLLRKNDLIDYGEAIVRAVGILRKGKNQAKMWNNRFKWIFCDEYQDTSPAQATLLQLLGQQSNLFVVGDNAQSIYSWQGADPDNLRRFELDFPNTATYSLSKNYRCFPKLVRMSSKFLERCGQTHGIRMEYDQKRSTEDQHVYFLHNESDTEEAKAIAKLAKQGLDLEIPGDPPPKATVGILARKWNLLETIEVALIREGIPYGFEGETAKGIVSSPELRQIAIKAGELYSQSIGEQEVGDTAEGKIVQRLRNDEILLASDLLNATRISIPGEDLDKNGMVAFNRLCKILVGQSASALGRMFLNDESAQKVILSTIHSQKGEEFDSVFVLGLEQGNSPHEPPKSHERLLEWRKVVQAMSHATWRSPLSDDDLDRLYEEEESRIFYVAMTRAKYNLIISRAETRLFFGKRRAYDQSRFLEMSNNPKLVSETSKAYTIKLETPTIQKAEGYRSDGRVYQADCGALVRSKSEMLLANEFSKQGMLFEYEESEGNITDALPDFSFPDYGRVILEHLGLLDDPIYVQRWDEKAKSYEQKGIRYFRTNEEEIKTLDNTVDRLRRQFRNWVEERYGVERIQMIDLIEKVRRKSDFKIGRSIGGFRNGLFEVEDSGGRVVAVSIPQFGDLSTGNNKAEIADFEKTVPGYSELLWEETLIDDILALFGRPAEGT